MGLLNKLFGKRSSSATKQLDHAYSKNDVTVITESAIRIVEVLNESLKLSDESSNPETKISRLDVAKKKLSEVKKLVADYPFLTLASLSEVERDIARLTQEYELAGYRGIAEGNALGERLEKADQIDEAIAQYEKLLEQRVDTPFTYRRLAILYRKRKQMDDELRVLQTALDNVPSSNNTHHAWFKDRLAKLER